MSLALRRKLLDHGARSLSDAEWHLLRISHLLNSLEDSTFERLLADSPLAELLALADGLAEIGSVDSARTMRAAATALAAANDPGRGLERSDAVATISRTVGLRLQNVRSNIEERLLDYAFRLRELQPSEPLAS